MAEGNICRTKITNQNRNTHNKSKKHNLLLLNIIINKYIVRNDEITKLKDILESYCEEHEKKFNFFTVIITWKKNIFNYKENSASR